MIQLALAVFGLTALFMAMGHNDRARRWAPIVGLCGQPFWIWFAIGVQAWGLLVLSLAYTAVYLRGAWVLWTWEHVKAELLAPPVKAVANTVIKWCFRLLGVKR